MIYKGIVNIKKYQYSKLQSSKTLHNEGTNKLFKSLCEFLAWNISTSPVVSYSARELPTKIDIIRTSDISSVEDTTVSSILVNPVIIQNKTIVTQKSESFVLMSAIIVPANVAKGSSAQGTVYICLTDDSRHPLAYVSTDSSEYSIRSDETHVISWQMGFENSSETMESGSDSGNESDGGGSGSGGTTEPTEPTIITFTVNDVSYQAEEGMTWERFVTSSYNTDSLFAIDDDENARTTVNGKYMSYVGTDGISYLCVASDVIDLSISYSVFGN